MTNDFKENLFVLIKSLSKSEKRQFKLFVGRMGSNSDSKFLNLFNLLDKMDHYDEQLILAQKIVSKQQLSNLKAHLYKQILISLRLNPAHKNIRVQIREQLDFATILYQKGLYKQSLKILDKAKNLALRHEEKYVAYEIVELEKVIESQYITRSLTNRATTLVQQASDLLNENQFCSHLSNLSLQLYERLIKAGYVKNDEEYREITQFFYNQLPKVQADQLQFREKLWYYKAHVWYSFLTQDFLSSFKYSLKWVEMFNAQAEMIEAHPVFYLKGNNYLMESLTLIKYPKKFKETLTNMMAHVGQDNFLKNDNLEALTFLCLYNNRLNLIFMTGEFHDGLQIIPEINTRLKSFKNRLDPHHVMMLYYKIACLYFGVDNYEKCILYLEKIIHNKHLKMREDLLCFTRVLNVVAHYEAGFDFHLETQIRDTFKFLIKMNDLYEVQKAMIRFMKRLSDIYPHELKQAFVELHSELSSFQNDRYERRSFLYLDILSWLESKIENRSIADIIKKKALHLNRKERNPIPID